MRFPPLLTLALAGALALVGGSGCSSFERDWRSFPDLSTKGLEGRWVGTWHSDTSGHQGSLRCMITGPGGSGDATGWSETAGSEESAGSGDRAALRYEARMRATYGAILSFSYTMALRAARDGEAWEFAGEEDLGWLAGGVYRYRGTVRGDTFEAVYESGRDRGSYSMGRYRGEGHPGED